jgi:hypothetical protein
MNALMHIRARFKLEPTHRVERDLRHLGGCCVIEVMQTRVRKTWKLTLDCSRIEMLVRRTWLYVGRLNHSKNLAELCCPRFEQDQSPAEGFLHSNR